MSELAITRDTETIRFEVRVKPRAKRDRVTGVEAGRLAVALAAPPVEGAANEALVDFLAEVLGVKRREVRLLRGERARVKLVEVPLPAEAALLVAASGS